jgi:hypothetical protein
MGNLCCVATTMDTASSIMTGFADDVNRERRTGRIRRAPKRCQKTFLGESSGIIGLKRSIRPIPKPSNKPDDRAAGLMVDRRDEADRQSVRNAIGTEVKDVTRPAGSGGREQDGTPQRRSCVPSMGWVKGSAEDAKEGGNNVVAPHKNTASVRDATRGALVGAGNGRDPALGRLPGGIRGHDLAFGQVYA